MALFSALVCGTWQPIATIRYVLIQFLLVMFFFPLFGNNR